MRTERAHSYTWPPSSPHQAKARPSRRTKTKEFQRDVQRSLGIFWPKSHCWAQRGSQAFSLCLLRTWQARAILYRGESFLPSRTSLCLVSSFPQLTMTRGVISHCAALPLTFFRPVGWSAWFPEHLPPWHLCLTSPCPRHPTSSLGIHDPTLVSTESVLRVPQEALLTWDGGHLATPSFPQLTPPGLGPRKTNRSSVASWQPSFDFCFNKGWEGEFEPCGYLHFKTFKQSVHLPGTLCFSSESLSPTTSKIAPSTPGLPVLLLLMYLEDWWGHFEPCSLLGKQSALNHPWNSSERQKSQSSKGKYEGEVFFVGTTPTDYKMCFHSEGESSQLRV